MPVTSKAEQLEIALSLAESLRDGMSPDSRKESVKRLQALAMTYSSPDLLRAVRSALILCAETDVDPMVRALAAENLLHLHEHVGVEELERLCLRLAAESSLWAIRKLTATIYYWSACAGLWATGRPYLRQTMQHEEAQVRCSVAVASAHFKRMGMAEELVWQAFWDTDSDVRRLASVVVLQYHAAAHLQEVMASFTEAPHGNVVEFLKALSDPKVDANKAVRYEVLIAIASLARGESYDSEV